MAIPDRPQAVYRHYSERGQLLYIGRSVDPDDRWRRLQIQWPEWTYLSVRRTDTWCPDWRTAKQVEREAIHVEQPLFNIQGRRGRWESFAGSRVAVELLDGSVLQLTYTGWSWKGPEAAKVEIAQWRRLQGWPTAM